MRSSRGLAASQVYTRIGLLAVTTACAHGAAPEARPGLPPSRPTTAPASMVRFEPATPATPPDPGSLLRLGGTVVAAGEAGGDRPPVPGARINLEVEDADLHSVLGLISEVSGLDFVVDESVRARVTVALRDVPWNHALLAILDAHGLATVPLPGGRGVTVVPAR